MSAPEWSGAGPTKIIINPNWRNTLAWLNNRFFITSYWGRLDCDEYCGSPVAVPCKAENRRSDVPPPPDPARPPASLNMLSNLRRAVEMKLFCLKWFSPQQIKPLCGGLKMHKQNRRWNTIQRSHCKPEERTNVRLTVRSQLLTPLGRSTFSHQMTRFILRNSIMSNLFLFSVHRMLSVPRKNPRARSVATSPCSPLLCSRNLFGKLSRQGKFNLIFYLGLESGTCDMNCFSLAPHQMLIPWREAGFGCHPLTLTDRRRHFVSTQHECRFPDIGLAIAVNGWKIVASKTSQIIHVFYTLRSCISHV